MLSLPPPGLPTLALAQIMDSILAGTAIGAEAPWQVDVRGTRKLGGAPAASVALALLLCYARVTCGKGGPQPRSRRTLPPAGSAYGSDASAAPPSLPSRIELVRTPGGAGLTTIDSGAVPGAGGRVGGTQTSRGHGHQQCDQGPHVDRLLRELSPALPWLWLGDRAPRCTTLGR